MCRAGEDGSNIPSFNQVNTLPSYHDCVTSSGMFTERVTEGIMLNLANCDHLLRKFHSVVPTSFFLSLQQQRGTWAQHTVASQQKGKLPRRLEDYTYTCGAQLSYLGLEGYLDGDHLCVHSIRCHEPLERLYFSAGQYELTCILCCSKKDLVTKEGCYPQCSDCVSRDPIKKREKVFFSPNFIVIVCTVLSTLWLWCFK